MADENARIAELDRLLAHRPDAFELLFERASLLRERGAYEDAKRDYLALIRLRPTDFGALNDFGTLALKAGYKDAAHSLYSEAVRHHPDNPMGHVNLGTLLFLTDQPEQARVHFEAALRLDPDHIHAHRGMGNLLAEVGDLAGAKAHRDRGFKDQFLTVLPYRGGAPPVRVLLLVSASGGNTPTASFLDERVFQTSVLVTEYDDPNAPLPPHDVVFNVIGDADLCQDGLVAACSVLTRTRRPVINRPDKVLKTGRLANAVRLAGLPNVITPKIAAMRRDMLAGADAAEAVARAGFSFPLLVRAPGFHTGRHFVRVESSEQLRAAVATFPGEDVWLIEQLDARDGEGMFRKLRVMFVGGKIYPLHLAISRHWKVHYFRADMADSAANRAIDREFLENMEGALGKPAVVALERICATLGLDYGGIDCAVNARGEVLLFEANATMVMAPLGPDAKWDYRRPAFDAVFAAVRRLLLDRAAECRAASA